MHAHAFPVGHMFPRQQTTLSEFESNGWRIQGHLRNRFLFYFSYYAGARRLNRHNLI